MRFAYLAFDRAGKRVRGVVEGAGPAEATEALRRQGLFPTDVRPAPGERAGGASSTDGSPSGPAHVERSRRTRAALRAVADMTRQLSVLISTGTPTVDALAAVERQAPPGQWREVVKNVRERVERGDMLSEALAAHPRWFDPVARALVAAGESSGRMDAMLARLAAVSRQQLRVRTAVAGAMVYPALLLSIAGVVVVVMVAFVMPRFEGLFTSLGAPLPVMTRLLLEISRFVGAWWFALIPALVALGAGAWWGLRTDAGRGLIDRAAVRAPSLGRVVRALTGARIARLLGVLVEGRVPVLDALRLTRAAMTNRNYAALLLSAEDAVVRGENVSAAWAGSPLLTPSLVEALRSGERSGRVSEVLLSVADAMDQDNEVVIKSLSSLIEPLILAFMGVVVGAIAVSMFLPLFDLAGAPAGPAPPGAAAVGSAPMADASLAPETAP